MWALDAWVPIELKSEQKCGKGLIMESFMESGWLMRRMCPCGMPSPTDWGTLGETL